MVQTDATIDCFCCGKQMGNWIYKSHRPDGTVNRVNVHPMGGLHFQTYGHYGSRVFDPMDGKGTTLDVAICDECIIANIRRLHGTGIDHAHRLALIENIQYKTEHDAANDDIMRILKQGFEDLEESLDD